MATKVFTPWLSAPAATNRKWINTAYGGYNKCITINTSTGSCLPNCVGWAWGRWVGLVGKNHKLSRSNAEDWYVTNDGYTRGQTPKLGAVICWRGGRVGDNSDGRGHVGIVEKIYSDKSILCSMSDAWGSRFYTLKLKPPYALSGLTFQGFIYTPTTYVEKTNGGSTKKEVTCKGVATHYSASLAGTYKTTANLHCRDAAGTKYASLVVIPKGTKVKNYGYYSVADGAKWLCIQFTLNGTTYTGFSSKDYLKKI